jgi:hypothetical protein
MPCVYTIPEGLCDGQAPLSKNEHYLPRALGNFRDDDRLVDRICSSCQARFAQLEDVFAHNSAEAFFREMVGRVGRKNHRGKNIFYEPTMGISPLTVLGKPEGFGFEILWELVTDAPGCRPMSQFVFIGSDGKTLQMPFRRGTITVDQIRTALRERGIEGYQIVAISNGEDEAEEMKALTDELAPEGREGQLPPLRDGARLEGEMRAPISAEFLRAVSKIGFHFILRYFTQFSGLEREFDDVKRFIFLGAAERTIVSPLQEPFVHELRSGSRMKRWGHLLSAECREQGIEARVQFFAGPQVQPIVWRVLIGRNPARIIYEQAAGYAYLYFEDVGGEYHGERVELTPIGRILIPPGPPTLKYYQR